MGKGDSILPDIEAYGKIKNITIIGTMKTSLRQSWQEVVEEIERTKIPAIHPLTADETIPAGKAKEMSNHNIIVIAYDWMANSDGLRDLKNIISFEEYLFEEIPEILAGRPLERNDGQTYLFFLPQGRNVRWG